MCRPPSPGIEKFGIRFDDQVAFISQVPTEPKRPTARRDARRIGSFVRRCDCPRHHGRQPLRLCGREHNLLHLRRFQCLPRVTNVMACRSWKLQAERPVFHMREPSGITRPCRRRQTLWPPSGGPGRFRACWLSPRCRRIARSSLRKARAYRAGLSSRSRQPALRAPETPRGQWSRPTRPRVHRA